MTKKMREALRLLVEHGNGDVSGAPTELQHGTPCVNLSTALALDKAGYVHAFEEPSWMLWGGIELLPAGERAYYELVESPQGEGET